ncbi:restriction endonuclease subunit S [Faecalibacterium prausnitzii]|uniref:restriction endonuclease subunit S n=1 Tax=Faecalibacterium prausnitzii TaxID=853 RepID=UPI001CBF2318|nr:restriction endonuclease subunit S [Faecalibacterium prausnitzii]
MSKLDEMIRELCPDGAEYVKLNSVCDIYDGTHSTPNYTESGVKFASVENIGNLYATRKYISEKDFEKYKIKPRIGDVMMTRIGSVGVCTVVDRNEALAFYVSLALLRPQLDKVQSRFLKYAIESIHGRKELRKRTLINAVPIKINKDDIGKVTIPLPPIEIQSEIVHTLDNYTENVVKLQNQLTAELTARKTQYAYYRDKLLQYKMPTKEYEVGEICEVSAGGDVPKEHFSKEKSEQYKVPVISNGCGINAFYGYTDAARVDKPAVTVAARGTIGYAEYRDYPYFPIIRLITLIPRDDKQLNAKYLYYSLEGRHYKVPTSGIPQLTVPVIKKEKVSIPPLDVQNRIVNVLDNFEKICSDLNIGLPAEIEARQKQYEYYRDKLLTFAETGNTILSRAEQSRAEQSRAEQSRAEQSRAEQSRAEQSRALIKLLQYVFGYVRISLGDIGSICMCKRILKSQTNTVGGVPFYKIGTFGKEADAYISQETFNEYRSKYNFPKKGDVLISAAGTIGRTVVYDGKPAYFQDSNIVWIDNDESIVLNSYLRYCYELKPWKASEGGTIPRLYNDNIAKAVIAVPSIEEQKRVVSILDRFDAICNDLTSGLPAEIEARQKQYEYYRNKLLSFKERL